MIAIDKKKNQIVSLFYNVIPIITFKYNVKCRSLSQENIWLKYQKKMFFQLNKSVWCFIMCKMKYSSAVLHRSYVVYIFTP